MNIVDAPCRHCGREVKIVRLKFGQEPRAVLNAVPDHVAGDWFITPKTVVRMDDVNARVLRGVGRDLYTAHECPGIQVA